MSIDDFIRIDKSVCAFVQDRDKPMPIGLTKITKNMISEEGKQHQCVYELFAISFSLLAQDLISLFRLAISFSFKVAVGG